MLTGADIITAAPILLFSSTTRLIRLSLIDVPHTIAPMLQFLIGVFVYRGHFTAKRLIALMIARPIPVFHAV